MRILYRCFSALAVSILMLGCDSAPGPVPSGEHAPVLSNLNFSPTSVLLDNLPGGIVDDTAHFSLDLSADVSDADGDVDRLFILVQSPSMPGDPVGYEEVSVPGNGRVQVQVAVTIPAAEIGLYSVRAYVSDRAGHLGNQAIGSLIVDSSSEPPVIDQIDIPDHVTLPQPGEPAVVIAIVAHVSDPDGLANILRVTATIGDTELNMCDDGGSGMCNAGFPDSGDEVANDGQFTIKLQLDSSNQPGTYPVAITAEDRAGLKSATEHRTIEIE